MRIRYGDVLITKTSLKPYYLTLAYLILSSVVSLLRYYLYTTGDEDKIALNYWNNVDGNSLIAATRFLLSITHVFFIYFIAVRINSCAIMYQFMVYQRGYRLEELDIVKEEFNNVERKSLKLMRRIMFMYAVLTLSLSFCNSIILKDWVPQEFSIGYNLVEMGAYLTVLRFYVANHYLAYSEMKKRHHDAYREHGCKGIWLLVLTAWSILLKALLNFAFMTWRQCMEEQRNECTSYFGPLE